MHKVIIQGRFEFLKERSFRLMKDRIEQRLEVYYKNFLCLDPEEIFIEEKDRVEIPRLVTESSDKNFKYTVALLKEISDYAVSGHFEIWRVDKGNIIDYQYIEPGTGKRVAKHFKQGEELSAIEGKEQEAREALNKVIKKFDKHAQAYERRGIINYRLGNYDDAHYDFTKSIRIYERNPGAYVGRAIIKSRNNDIEEALEDLEMAIKYSIALQPIFWKANILKGKILIDQKRTEEVMKIWDLYLRRKNREDNPANALRSKIYYLKAQTHIVRKEYKEAENALVNASEHLSDHSTGITKDEILLLKGKVDHLLGNSEFQDNWKEAQGLGSLRAESMLRSVPTTN